LTADSTTSILGLRFCNTKLAASTELDRPPDLICESGLADRQPMACPKQMLFSFNIEEVVALFWLVQNLKTAFLS
jgi:hypothetical protein